MKLALALTAALVLLGGCGQSREQQAIVSVLDARRKAEVQSTRGALNHPAYLKAINQIDASGTPQKFREAWLNYLGAWNTLARVQKRGLMGILEFPFFKKKALSDLKGSLGKNEVPGAIIELESAAKASGVQCEKISH